MVTMTVSVRKELSRGCLRFRERRAVTMEDAERAVELAHHVQLSRGRVLLDFRLLHFLVDEAEVIKPLGMNCNRLEALAEITTADEM